MSNLLENQLPVVMSDGVNTNKNVTIGGSANFDASGSTGTFKFPTGAVTFGGGAVALGNSVVSGINELVIQSALVGATVQLTAAQSGAVLINRSTSGSPSWTLPASAASGVAFTFICANTTAGFTVTSATQVIHFKTSASGTVLTTTTTLTNTQGTAIVGDFISIVSDGTAFWMTAISGIFAAS